MHKAYDEEDQMRTHLKHKNMYMKTKSKMFPDKCTNMPKHKGRDYLLGWGESSIGTQESEMG